MCGSTYVSFQESSNSEAESVRCLLVAVGRRRREAVFSGYRVSVGKGGQVLEMDGHTAL